MHGALFWRGSRACHKWTPPALCMLARPLVGRVRWYTSDTEALNNLERRAEDIYKNVLAPVDFYSLIPKVPLGMAMVGGLLTDHANWQPKAGQKAQFGEEDIR